MSLQLYRVWRSTLCHIPKPHWTGDTLVGKAILGFTTKGMLGSYFFFRIASLSPGQTFTNTSLSSSLYPTNRLTQKAAAAEATIYTTPVALMLTNTPFFEHWGLAPTVLNTSSGNETANT